jgi:hypothetical protein
MGHGGGIIIGQVPRLIEMGLHDRHRAQGGVAQGRAVAVSA